MSDLKRRALSDFILSGLVIAGACLLFIGAADLPPPRFEPLGSAALPRILGTLLVVFAILIALRAVLRLRTEQAQPAVPSETNALRGVLVFVALVAYVFALDILRVPFIPATTVFVAAVGLSIGERTWRNALLFAALGLVLAVAISSVFERFLYISFG